MRILVTGGSGFIGRNIVEQLPAYGDYSLLAPPRKELDLTDQKLVREYFAKHNVDVVIHSAVRPGHRNAVDSSNQLYLNSQMFFNIVRNSDYYGKMIYLGSGSVYDMRNYQPKMLESFFDTYVPVDEGAFSKYIAAKYIERVDNAVELRIFGIFGKYEDYAIRFISNAVCKALFDLPVTLKQDRLFDYLFINDLMPVLSHFIQQGCSHKAYNVTPDHSVGLHEIAKTVLRIAGKELPICVGVEGMGMEYSGDNSRLREEIPGLAFSSMETSVAALYDWYAGNKGAIRRECLLTDH